MFEMRNEEDANDYLTSKRSEANRIIEKTLSEIGIIESNIDVQDDIESFIKSMESCISILKDMNDTEMDKAIGILKSQPDEDYECDNRY